MSALKLVSLDAAVQQTPPRDWLIESVIERGSFFGIIGPAEAGKTFVAVDLASAVASGTQWLGMPANGSGKVVYLSSEASHSVVRRLAGWQVHHGVKTGANIFVPTVTAALTENSDLVLDELEQANPDLLIVDTWARATPGMNENSAEQVSETIRRLDILRSRTGCAIGIVHHVTASTGKARGSTALNAAFDTEFTITPDEVPGVGSLRQSKVKDGVRSVNNSLNFHIVSTPADPSGDTVGVIVPTSTGGY